MNFVLKVLWVFLGGVPLGNLHAKSHHPQEFLQAIKGVNDEGGQIVNHFCTSCHAARPLIPLGAPRINNENDWAPRVKQGLAVLLQHTETGFNAMPPRGGCFECSDHQLNLAIQAMLPESLKAAGSKKPIK